MMQNESQGITESAERVIEITRKAWNVPTSSCGKNRVIMNLINLRDKPCHSWRGRIARAVKPPFIFEDLFSM